jgi:hypothetical protein
LTKRESCWISTTQSEQIARSRFGKNGVVRIDLSKVKTEVLDISEGLPNAGRMKHWAINAQEVLIRDRVPARAVTVTTFDGGVRK